MSDVFAALASPTRRRILDLLTEGEMPAGEVVASLPSLPQPAVSRHLKVLREAGLVTVEPRANLRVYALAPAALKEVDRWVAHYRPFWTDRLDLLERHLEDEAGSRGKPKKRAR